jgi:hypothetical protein
MPESAGPHLAVAVVCEKPLQEQDGVLSIIRIIDRVIVSASGPDVPDTMPPTQLSFFMVVTLKSGAARGRHTLRLRPEDPSGAQLNALEVPIHFEGEERGANVVVQFNLNAELEGLYWIDVLFGEDVMTRIPLRVVYQPQKTAGS